LNTAESDLVGTKGATYDEIQEQQNRRLFFNKMWYPSRYKTTAKSSNQHLSNFEQDDSDDSDSDSTFEMAHEDLHNVSAIELMDAEEEGDELRQEKKLDKARQLDTDRRECDDNSLARVSDDEGNEWRSVKTLLPPEDEIMTTLEGREIFSSKPPNFRSDVTESAESSLLKHDKRSTTIRLIENKIGRIRMTAEECWEELLSPNEQRILAAEFFRIPQSQHDLFTETKYKPVGKKVLPINTSQPPTNPNPPLRRPALSRNPFSTPLRQNCPPVVYSTKVTKERCDALDFGPAGWLQPEEENLYRTILVLREKALAFEDKDRGVLRESYAAPYVFSTKEHTPWRQRPLPIPKAIQEDVIQLIKDRLESGLYEEAVSPYSGRWFVVQKKMGNFD
jgi:hypothetical protein